MAQATAPILDSTEREVPSRAPNVGRLKADLMQTHRSNPRPFPSKPGISAARSPFGASARRPHNCKGRSAAQVEIASIGDDCAVLWLMLIRT